MNAQTKNKHTTACVKLAKERFDNFSEAKSHKVFLIIKEAKSRGLLQKQPPDRCLSPYINAANRILETFGTATFFPTISLNITHVYAYVALVATNTIKITAA
ncbi:MULTISPECIES: hypothetical protein [unclassified Microcoleus]|uniref:hypothetical protein n=1 Tax=unclassified Microcoleus TaxID=2642155 RepID=UPI0025EFE85E|nr:MULTISPECIES: hypothetical protein [unclassified Microcoleus]